MPLTLEISWWAGTWTGEITVDMAIAVKGTETMRTKIDDFLFWETQCKCS